MAFITPVIRRDFNLYELRRKNERTKSVGKTQTSMRTKPGKEGSSLDSLLDRQKKLAILREHHRQHNKTVRRCNTLTMRQISVITEDEEEIEENNIVSDLSNQLANAELTKSDASPTCASSEGGNKSQQTGAKAIKANDKKGVLNAINQWVRSHSIRRSKPNKTFVVCPLN